MEKRAYGRISSNLFIKFYHGYASHTGIVTNISENGMFIKSNIDLPFKLNFEVIIPLNNDVLRIPCRVARLTKKGNIYDGIGVQLLERSSEYEKLVGKMRASLLEKRTSRYPATPLKYEKHGRADERGE